MRGLNLDSVLRMIRRLPGLPETHTRVMALAEDSETSTSEIAHVVRSDTALAARVLHLANTPFYGMSGRIESVARAVVTLGARTVHSLAIGDGMAQVLKQQDPRKECRIDVWKHCLQTAVAARVLAESNGTIDPDIAFTGGLLHDMGKLVLAVMFPEAYRSVLNEHAESGVPLIDIEHRTFGIDHARAGAVLCDTWHLPNSLSCIVQNHHSIPLKQDNVDCAVACGSVIARLVTPDASGEIHIRESELSALMNASPRIELLRRLVVSQSMQPHFSAESDDAPTVLVDVTGDVLRETIQLVALTCGFTPLTRLDSHEPSIIISDCEVHATSDRAESLDVFTTESKDELLVNVSRLHSILLQHSLQSAEFGMSLQY